MTTILMSGTANAQIISSNSSRIETNQKVQEIQEINNYKRLFFGYAPTKFSFNHDSEKTTHGFNVGWIGGYNVAKKRLPIYLETGLMLNASFGECLSERDKLISLEVPVNVTYRWKISSNSDIFFAPYFGFHFKVNAAWLDNTSYSYFGSNTNRFQLGMQLGGNFDIDRFTIGLGWNYDFVPIAEDFVTVAKIHRKDMTLTTSGLRINIGFLF